ncbi:hypothetical protein [Ornithinimicrobium pratense]|uniref:Membrane protein ArfC n=1 Tax=Ornithinimicrobium pratense TaxID=2593973 RepID=A0A5J6V1C3_9MICO|nr:hypothetical protein [Ornithinimicrobium pratense]QFG67549.1 hypothetical protein FY030_01350 [Ornithinimicrobium pratense]
MDNSTTTWIIVALLVLLIGAAIFMLLRRPGGEDSLDGKDAPAVDRDTDRRGDLDGRTAPEEAQAVATGAGPARDDAPFDQTSYDSPAATGGATPVHRADVADRTGVDAGDDPSPTRHVADDTTEARRPADDFLGVDRESRDEVEPDPMFQDPRTDGHRIAEDEASHDEARHDEARHDEARHDGATAADRPGDEGRLGAPAHDGYHAEPASQGYVAAPADEQAYQAPPAASEPPQQQSQHEHTHLAEQAEHPAGGVQDEPLTADEVLDSRDAADRDHRDGHAEPPVAAEPAATESVTTQSVTTQSVTDEPTTDEPTTGGQRDAAVGGHVFAESVYGVGSVEPAEDGSGPEGWEIKGNTGSMLFHTADSPSYDAMRAEVWFDSEESARSAGFAHWDRRRR